MSTKRYRLIQPLPGISVGTEYDTTPDYTNRDCTLSGGYYRIPLAFLADPTFFEEIVEEKDDRPVVEVGAYTITIMFKKGEHAFDALPYIRTALTDFWRKEGGE